MPVGDCQRAFEAAARLDGIELLIGPRVRRLTDAGHLGLDQESEHRELLREIFLALGGDEDDLATGAHRPLQLDLYHKPSRTAIEIDEFQHFTSDRLKTLNRYPADAPLGFSLEAYKALCRKRGDDG